MNEAVLDASALLAFLRAEPGFAVVTKQLENGAYISAANWAEVLSKVSELGVDCQKLAHDLRTQGVLGGALIVAPLTEEDALTIGKIRIETKKSGLSLGDRACLALAIRMKARALTTDRTWLTIKITGLKVEVIR